MNLKHGTIREDGKIFLYYQSGSRKEVWVTQEQFDRRRLLQKKRQKEAREANPEKYRQACSQWRLENREKWLECKRNHRAKNIARLRLQDAERVRVKRRKNPELTRALEKSRYERHKEKRLASNKAYRDKNREKINAKKRDYIKVRRKTCPLWNMAMRFRSRVANAMRKKNWRKDGPSVKLLGCTWQELMDHLEKQFLLGMTWENRDQWHIDHIIPCASAKTEEELLPLFKYTNLQPLWKKDNLAKGAKITAPDTVEST